MLGPLAYYLAMSQRISPWSQGCLWLGSFLLAGWVWRLALRQPPPARVSAAAALVLALPAPWLAWLHASTPAGPTWGQFGKALLLRNFQVPPPEGLLWIYEPLAIIALGLELGWLVRHQGPAAYPRAALGAGLAFVAVNLLATPLGWALRGYYGS